MLMSYFCFSQALQPKKLVQELRQTKKAYNLSLANSVSTPSARAKQLFSESAEFNLKQNTLNFIQENDVDFIELNVPLSDTKTITLELAQVEIYQGNTHIYTLPENKKVPINVGKHYRGIVKGEESSIVAFSFFDDEVAGLVSQDNLPLINIGKLENSTKHIAYRDELPFDAKQFECSMADDGIVYSEDEIYYQRDAEAERNVKCVQFYIEVDYSIFRKKGSVDETSKYIIGAMNQVVAIYAQERIKTTVSPLKIWSSPSPYTSSSASSLLNQFASRTRSLDAEMGQLVTFTAGGGVAAGFSGLCTSRIGSRLSVGGIRSNYEIFPTYSWTTVMIAHEFGHLLGSRHTHGCVWNGNGTAIDSCAGFVEGGCRKPGYPDNGGTIMSYCDNVRSVGINLNKGFHPQPGNVVRARVDKCVTRTCTDDGDDDGGDDGGGNDPDTTPPSIPINLTATDIKIRQISISWNPSQDEGGLKGYEVFVNNANKGFTANTAFTLSDLTPNTVYTIQVRALDKSGNRSAFSNTIRPKTLVDPNDCKGKLTTLKLLTDKYPRETSWVIFDENNKVVVKSDKLDKNKAHEFKNCLPAGCYTFQIIDSYGDGICCSYGNGRFEFLVDGKTIAKGSEFGASFSKQFCIDKVLDTTAPTTPLNLNASNITENSAKLSWNKSTDNVAVIGYEIFQDGKSIGKTIYLNQLVKKLEPKTTYSFYVKAFDEAGNYSKQSNTARVTTLGPSSNCSKNENSLMLELTTDSYPIETSWDIKDRNGRVVGQGSQYDKNSSYEIENCLSDGCYTFSIKDAYKDGICCTHGQGSYKLTFKGKVIVEGAKFQAIESKSFCISNGEVRDNETPISYCTLEGKIASQEWIDYIEIGGIENQSGTSNGYQDFTSKVATLNLGSNNLVFRAGYDGPQLLEHWKVFIDYNQDGNFSPEEIAVSILEKAVQNTSTRFVVPNNARLGKTRMRIAMTYNFSNESCGVEPYGEVEDYTVNITNSSSGKSDREYTNEQASFFISPNPVIDGIAQLSLNNITNANYLIINNYGAVVKQGNISAPSKQINVQNLPTGIYLIQIELPTQQLTERMIIY